MTRLFNALDVPRSTSEGISAKMAFVENLIGTKNLRLIEEEIFTESITRLIQPTQKAARLISNVSCDEFSNVR